MVNEQQAPETEDFIAKRAAFEAVGQCMDVIADMEEELRRAVSREGSPLMRAGLETSADVLETAGRRLAALRG